MQNTEWMLMQFDRYPTKLVLCDAGGCYATAAFTTIIVNGTTKNGEKEEQAENTINVTVFFVAFFLKISNKSSFGGTLAELVTMEEVSRRKVALTQFHFLRLHS